MSTSASSRSSFLAWIVLVVAGMLLALVTHRLQPHLVPDSASYLGYSFGSADAIARAIRTPGYPAWLALLEGTVGIGAVPAAQVMVHATAVWMLLPALGAWNLPRRQRIAAAVAVGVGCTPMDHINTISTDAIAASVGVMVAATLLRWADAERSPKYEFLTVALAVIAIFIRPAYLFLVPWLFVIGSMLQVIRGSTWPAAMKNGLKLSAWTVVPLTAWMLFRFAVVGDFAMLPFGHQNLAGVLVQLVSDDELRGIEGDASRIANAVVDQKQKFIAGGGTFAEGEPGATMTIDARWDDMTYFVVVPASAEVAGNDPVARHRALAKLNRTIIRQWPMRYVIWLAKAARRGAWAIAADLVMNPIFLAAIGCALLAVLYRATSGTRNGPIPPSSLGLRALAIIAITYMVAKVGFVCLTSPPIGRFSDAAAIFLPAWIAAVFVHWWEGSHHAPP